VLPSLMTTLYLCVSIAELVLFTTRRSAPSAKQIPVGCRMIWDKCQMRQDAGRHFRPKTQMTHVHVGYDVFGDQLIFGRPFVKRFALRSRGPLPVGLSVLSVCL